MVDILFISLPSRWGRKYVYIENYWMIIFAQYISSYGYKVSTLDSSLKGYKLIDIQNHILRINPKILVYLVSKRNWEIVYQVKKKIVASTNILVWDDSFVLNEISNYIPEDENTINVNLDDLFNSIRIILPTPYTSQLYFEDTFLVGRDCLKQVLLEGGECEVVMQMPKRKWFSSDYVFYSERSIFEKNFERTMQEVITLCRKFRLRKINIINNELVPYAKAIDELDVLLKENNLAHVRIGIYIASTLFTDQTCEYLIEKVDLIYKIIFLSDFVTFDQIDKFCKLKKANIKVKVMSSLFHEQATTDSVRLFINAIRQGDIQVAPTALIAGNTSDPMLIQIQNIMRTLFVKIFLPCHQKIIEYENNKKYDMRIGKSMQYDTIPEIQKQVELLSQTLNDIFLSMLEDLLFFLPQEKEALVQIIIKLLYKYKGKIQKVGGDIDAYLFDSRRI